MEQRRTKMKTKTLLLLAAVLMSGTFAIPKTAFSQDRDYRRSERGWWQDWWQDRQDRQDRWSDREARRLQGRWYMNGDPNKPAEINSDRNGLVATNENGQTTRLEIDRDGDIRASDWQGLRGDVRGNRIEWDNGTTWTRRPSDRIGRR